MSEKLKIAELLDSYYPCIDGPINVVTYYTKHLNRATNCKLIVPAAKRSQKYVDNDTFEVIRCKSSSAPEGYRMGRPKSDGKLNKRMAKERFDLLHTHSPFTMGRFAIKIGRKYRVPVVATLHTKYYDDFSRVLHGFKPLCNFMLRWIMRVYNAADSVWTVNDASCQILRDYGYKGDIVVMRNGTDLKYPSNADELIARINELHHLEEQKNVFIFVGRIAMYKNLAIMADALRKLKDEGEDFKMLVIGSGFDEMKFRSMIDKLGLTENFVFVGSVNNRALLQGYYLRSDLFLFPSTFDTSSLVPIEAAAHKLPTLLIEGSCTAENIVDGVNGFLAKENAESYAEKIKEIISDPEKRRAVGEEAHRSVYRTWEEVSEEVLQKYHEVLDAYHAAHTEK